MFACHMLCGELRKLLKLPSAECQSTLNLLDLIHAAFMIRKDRTFIHPEENFFPLLTFLCKTNVCLFGPVNFVWVSNMGYKRPTWSALLCLEGISLTKSRTYFRLRELFSWVNKRVRQPHIWLLFAGQHLQSSQKYDGHKTSQTYATTERETTVE